MPRASRACNTRLALSCMSQSLISSTHRLAGTMGSGMQESASLTNPSGSTWKPINFSNMVITRTLQTCNVHAEDARRGSPLVHPTVYDVLSCSRLRGVHTASDRPCTKSFGAQCPPPPNTLLLLAAPLSVLGSIHSPDQQPPTQLLLQHSSLLLQHSSQRSLEVVDDFMAVASSHTAAVVAVTVV